MKLVNINLVKPNPKNPRIIRDSKFEKLVKSIQEFPDMLNKRPLIVFTDVDNKYVVLGGNMRLKALNELKDNVGFGEWDWDQLANEWDSEKLNDWGMDVPIYDDVNLDDFFEENNLPEDKEEKFTITLEYSEEDYAEVIELFGKKSGSKEQIVFELLKK